MVDDAGPGARNMAVDEALLERPDGAPAWTLRFYGWNRPTVSLGYAQPLNQGFDAAAARRHGIGVVRRLTGGRAVLHADEVTYSLVGPTAGGPLSGSVSEAYRLIAGGLRDGLQRLGVTVDLERGEASGRGAAKGPCFSARARYELGARGRKLAGSAQRRRDGRVLQHGSMPLGVPDPRLWSALGPGAVEAAAATIGLQEMLGARPSARTLTACLAAGVARSLRMPLRWGPLTGAERRRAVVLERRYRSIEWTNRR